MKWAVLIAVVCGFMALAPMSARADTYTMHTATTTVGNDVWSSVGLEFDVNTGIRVLELGIYDSGSDGITGDSTTLSTVVFDTATETPLVQMDFAAGDAGMWFDAPSNYLFKPLATPLVLAPGRYTIAGYGFDANNNEHNRYVSGTGPVFDTGGGSISYVVTVYGLGADAVPTYPAHSSGYPDYYDGPNMVFVPVPGAVLLGILGLGVVGLKLRKFA